MNVVLDGQNLFEGQGQRIEVGSLSRDSIERKVSGLDGILSIDIGGRGRKIKQTGVLWAKSRLLMNELVNKISAYIDGDTHTLRVSSGEEFGNLRMDVFRVSAERASGSGVVADYEIVYRQLAV